VRLRDGREVSVRRLTAADEGVLRAALTHADPVDLRLRFLGPPPPTSTIVRQLRRVDDVHDLALGAVGITQLTASYYAENLPVRRLLHRTGLVTESGISAGEGHAVLDLAS
jgi:hypothetical protein